jgi:hypothetical protein
VTRIVLSAMGIIAALLLMVSLPASCGVTQRQDTIHASVIAVDAARQGFVAWDLSHQQALADSATSRADAEAKLSAYRAIQTKIADGITLAYHALAIAATQTDDPSLAEALKDASTIVDDVQKLKGGN